MSPNTDVFDYTRLHHSTVYQIVCLTYISLYVFSKSCAIEMAT